VKGAVAALPRWCVPRPRCWPGSAPVGSILRSWTYPGNPGVSPRGASVLVLRVPGAGV